MISISNSTLSDAVEKLKEVMPNKDIKITDPEYDNRVKLILPGNDKLESDFAKELLPVLLGSRDVYYRIREMSIQTLRPVSLGIDQKEVLSFITLNPHELKSLVERYAITGSIGKDGFKKISMTAELAKTMLASDILKRSLPIIDTIYMVQLPFIRNEKLVFPKLGYDKSFMSWVPTDAPQIKEMGLEEAKSIIDTIYSEFCFEKPQDKTNAIAALLTPYLRGLYPRLTCRTPIVFYKANRERSGKDYCAEITAIVYLGVANSEPPISDGRNTNDEEFRKKILSHFMAGRSRYHSSNNRGHLASAQLESLSTNETFSDRILGQSKIATYANILEISLSANLGITYTPDLANRCIFINLFLDIEDPNTRTFEKPNLHGWVKENRAKILSALATLVQNWFDKGMPPGSVPFASFPDWARVCGGIMEAAGYGNPCLPNIDPIEIGGDTETKDMKKLFEVVWQTYGEQWMTKKDLINKLASQEEFKELFSYLNFEDQGDKIKFGCMFEKYIGRIFSDIKLERENNDNRSRRKYRWVKGVTVSQLSHFPQSNYGEKKEDNIHSSIDCKTVTSVTGVTSGGSNSPSGLPKSSTNEEDVNQRLPEETVTTVTSVTDLEPLNGFEIVDKTYHPCHICGEDPCYYQGNSGLYYCVLCAKQIAENNRGSNR